MKQNGLTILTAIDPTRVTDLEVLLRALGDDVAGQTQIPFRDLTRLHFASWVVFAAGVGGPQLIFEANFDGDADSFLRQLAQQASTGLSEIYSHCVGFRAGGGADAVCQYLQAHIVNTDTFYVSCGGFTRDQVLQENQLRERIEAFLGETPPEIDPAALRHNIQQFVSHDPALAWARQPAPPYTFVQRLRVRDVVLAVGLLAGLFGPLLGWGLRVWGAWLLILIGTFVILYGILRWKEATDASISTEPVEDAQPDPAAEEELVGRENRRPQNHMASITPVKPGIFRFALLKAVLTAIELLGRIKYYHGNLSGIPSIHFARWTVINSGQHLLFLSNFDGSWEHYLGEFIDQAANGLTAVWSNAVDFPRTRNLIQGGATDEQRFKSYARRTQLYTQLWYSAYPYLSVVNIQNNAAIRSRLWGELQGEELHAWLRRF
jgi:hypothetical protein